jgi:cytochrome c
MGTTNTCPASGCRHLVWLILTVAVALAGDVQAQAPKLLQQYKCYYCHADNEEKAGPSFADVAARYKGKSQAVGRLIAVVRNGRHGDGPWHMPPHPEVSEAEAKEMVRYILSLKQ